MLEVFVLSVEALHHPHAGNVLVVFPIDHGDGTPDAHERMPGEALPVGQDKKQWRDDAQAHQGQPPVGYQHGDDNARQAEDVSQGRYEQLKRLLQLQDIALAARHDASDRGAMKEGRRQALQVIEELGAHAVQHPLSHSSNGNRLQVIGPEVHQGDGEEDQAYNVQAPPYTAVNPPVDPQHNHQREAYVCRRIHEHSDEAEQGVLFVWPDIGEQASDHSIVIDFAYDDLIAQLIRRPGRIHTPGIGPAPATQDITAAPAP